MSRKICVVTGSRAEYGLLRWVMEGIRSALDLELQVVVTGMHLSPTFGLTYREIEEDGFVIDQKVEMLVSSDTALGLSKSMGLGLIGMGEALQRLQPDLMLVVGDRFEILSAVSAALAFGVPIAHAHGGESTEGAFDEAIRHAITKMSHLHFVAAEDYRRRVVQLGEHPDRVFLVGGLGVDAVKRSTLLDRTSLEASLNFKLARRNLLVTYHPATLEGQPPEQPMGELLAALETLEDTHLIFTMPNADPGGQVLFRMVERFVDAHPNARLYSSLGQLRYLSCMRHMDAVVGNSSSGLLEAPSLHTATVNIGDRQRGRLKAHSVIDCRPTRQSISAALKRVYSPEFQATLDTVRNPYGEGNASEKIVEVLRTASLEGMVKKTFHDLRHSDREPRAAI